MRIEFEAFKAWEAHRSQICGCIFIHLVVGILPVLFLVAHFHGCDAGIDLQFPLTKAAAWSMGKDDMRIWSALFCRRLLRCLYIIYRNFETARGEIVHN